MPANEINCPSCGASLPLRYHATKTITCRYCGQSSFLENKVPVPKGVKTTLADYGSIFAVGKTGKVQGQAFEVLGRLRFAYEDGFWDEWLLLIGGREHWLQEDEGEFALYVKSALQHAPPAFDAVEVGKNIELNGKHTFVTEKNRSEILACEGELPFEVITGQKAAYIDGIAPGGLPVSLEYMPDETAFNTGKVVELEEISFEN